MDFFQHQDAARKNTSRLIVYFVLAVISLVLVTNAAMAGILLLGETQGDHGGPPDWSKLWNPGLFAVVTAGTLAVIGGGSAFRVASLSGGGHSVAEILGGRPLDSDTRDPDERKVLNVVEEMAIASGTPVPPVYLLEGEEGINAFAAGYTPSDAVIGVTRGCVQKLSRDELQGVIAHEFSHILNGDMKLNIRLMGVLYGILLVSVTGWWLFRSSMYSSGSSRSSDDKKGGNPLPLIGLALFVIGYLGVIFGRLIKAAVSRQREYLADASAVQFTRNPSGIAGALKKIGANAEGALVKDHDAEEASHMFFGDALGLMAYSPMASHPPLVDRIRRIDPSFDGDFSEVDTSVPASQRFAQEQAAAGSRKKTRDIPFNPVDAITKIGTLGPQNLAYATALLGSIPDPVANLAREPFGAIALVYALLLDDDPSIRKAQLLSLQEQADPAILRELNRVIPQVESVLAEARLPLVELAIPALRRLSPDQFRQFVEEIRHLMEADNRVSLFEYALRRMLLRHLGPKFGWGQKTPPSVSSPGPLAEPMSVLLSALARIGQSGPDDQQRAYQVGAQALRWPVNLGPILSDDQASLKAVDRALGTLSGATPTLKKSILEACASCIGADGRVTLEESELLRAVADALDCPMPPIAMESPQPTMSA